MSRADEVPVQRDGDVLFALVLAQQSHPAQFGHPGLLHGAMVVQFIRGGAGQQTERVAQPHMFGFQIAGSWR